MKLDHLAESLAVAVDHLTRYYDERLRIHGDTPEGAAWPNEADRATRFDVAIDLVVALAPDRTIVVCDLGCGTGELLARLRERALLQVEYVGVDVSGAALAYARRKFPETPFHELDVLAASDAQLEHLRCDVLVANGLFTVKGDLTEAAMWSFMTSTLQRVWPLVRRGVVFNVMSTLVDRQREDLFHVSYDRLACFLHELTGRSIGFRADYGLYEYMAYAAKRPLREPSPVHAGTARVAVAADEAAPIQAYRARLPRVDALTPYLATLDRTRRYSNHGELVRTFESRLAARFDLAPRQAVSASSGTAAIAGAILGSAGRADPAKPYCLCPAYTFVGTACAIEQCGYRIHLTDVDAHTWSLDPERLLRHPLLPETGLVVVVAPYGRMPSQHRWAAFTQETGIPVVIDAAAGFEAILADASGTLGRVPVALSFHASKSFSTGEGGAVLCSDADRAASIARALNFGFFGRRVSRGASLNGKMSEYHAAVGLAELDGWAAKHSAFAAVAATYVREAERSGIAGRIVTAPVVASCYALFVALDAEDAAAVRAALGGACIEHRLWYGDGLHREPAFATALRDGDLDGTERIAPAIVGLPTAPDLAESSVKRIVRVIAGAVRLPKGA
jgi:dTDP-4-amino-4,6-dideoxygalactose transaminase